MLWVNSNYKQEIEIAYELWQRGELSNNHIYDKSNCSIDKCIYTEWY